MSVMAHGQNPKVTEAFLAAADPDSKYAECIVEHAYHMAAPAVRRLMEEIMTSTKWPVYSPFAREHYGRGRAEEAANNILMVLSARGVTVPGDARDRITTCTDLDQLESWVERAATADTIDDVFC